jgi:phosphoribosylglycinamide formyltransferase-1
VTSPLRLAALISGGGRTLLNIADQIDRGELHARIDLVISSRAEAAGVQRARQRGFDLRIGSEDALGGNEDDVHQMISDWIAEAQVDLVCLCGYMRWLRVDADLVGRVVNIHPALLPEFGGSGMYGMHVHRAVLASGAPMSGCTVHFVDEVYDHGPIILQRCCPTLPDDDEQALAARVFEQECVAYPEAIKLFADGRIKLRGNEVQILPSLG